MVPEVNSYSVFLYWYNLFSYLFMFKTTFLNIPRAKSFQENESCDSYHMTHMDEIFWTFPASLHFDRRQYWHLGLRGILLRYFHLFSNFQVKWALQRHIAVIIKILTNFIIMELIIAFWWKLKIVWRLSTHSSMTRYGWPDWRHIGLFLFLGTWLVCHVVRAHFIDGLYHMP